MDDRHTAALQAQFTRIVRGRPSFIPVLLAKRPHRRRKIRPGRAILPLVLCTPALWGQLTATISGRVSDPTGAGVGGAKVTVQSMETGTVHTILSIESGDFRFLSLPLGRQEVKVEKAGFRTAVRTGIDLQIGQEATVNFQLELGELSERAIVSGDTAVVNTTTASVSGLVDQQQIADLPLNGRSVDGLVTLNPGAIDYLLKSPQTITSNGNTFSISGRRPSDTLFLWNGVEYTGSSQLAVTPGGVSGELLGIDAVREFNVLTGPYGAEYGKRSGAQVTVVTRSGSNVLHGSLFEFLRNSALDAEGIFDHGPVPPFRRNQFGGALGGPLKKDRLFVFGNYEGFRQRLALSSVGIVPDQLARQGLLPNGAPVANLNPYILPYMSYWPQPNGPELPSVTGQPGVAYSFNHPEQFVREDFGTVRADYILRDRDSLTFSYTVDDGNSLIPQADPLFASALALRNQVGTFQETHTLSPSAVNLLTAGYSRAAFNYDSVPLASFSPSLSFVRGEGPGGIVVGGGVTTTGGGSITSAGPNNAANVWNRRNLFTVDDTLQTVKGRHLVSAGVWVQRLQDNDDTASRQLGQATFTSLTTFLQGNASSFQVVPNHTELGWRSLFGAWYIQDAVRLRSNLTVQVGVRHELTTGWNEVSGRAANYILGTQGALLTNPRVADSVFTENNATRLFSPRFGLAWDVFGDGKTAVHAGFGTYYSLIDALSFLLNSLPPYNGTLTFSGPLTSIVPILHQAAAPPSCGPGVPQPCSTFGPQGVQATAKTPTVQEWSLSIEQEITPTVALSVVYLGSFGYHGLLSVDANTIQPLICATPTGCESGGVFPSGVSASPARQGHVPQGAQYIPVSTRPNPYLGAGFFWFTEGNSRYNALEIDVTKRLGRDLQFRANYTLSKNLDMNSGLTGAQADNQAQMVMDPYDPSRDWGPSALTPPHQASISFSYELPFGRGRFGHGGFEGKLIRDWQVHGIVTLLSGFPFTPLIGTNLSGDGDIRNPDRPSLNPSFTGSVLTRRVDQWYDPGAFVLPVAGTYGDLGRGTLSGPGLVNIDFSIFKAIPMNERLRLQVRGEFFNLLNRMNLSTPNATVFSNGAVNPSAGVITALANAPRQIQFGLKVIF